MKLKIIKNILIGILIPALIALWWMGLKKTLEVEKAEPRHGMDSLAVVGM